MNFLEHYEPLLKAFWYIALPVSIFFLLQTISTFIGLSGSETDADTDGMHIRLLLLTFFLQFFPDLVKKNHVYILQTPLFRVRNKKETIYCYSEEERVAAINKLGVNPEITRFKGLGEISPDEFQHFIGKDIRLDKVTMKKEDLVKDMLNFYMGKNTPERQVFIIDNLVQIDD